MSELLTVMRRANEAHAVRFGIAVERQFTDADLECSNAALDEIEAKLYRGGSLIPFRVTVTTAGGTEQVNIIATDACMANMNAVELLFPGFDCEKIMAIKIKVEPLHVAQIKEAA